MATRGKGLTSCGAPPEESAAWPADVAHNNHTQIQLITLSRNENRFIGIKENTAVRRLSPPPFPMQWRHENDDDLNEERSAPTPRPFDWWVQDQHVKRFHRELTPDDLLVDD